MASRFVCRGGKDPARNAFYFSDKGKSMRRREWILVALVLVLGGSYVVFWTNVFGPKAIRIEHTARSLRDAYGPGGVRVGDDRQQLGNVTFTLHQPYRLTSVKVVDASDAATNGYPHALWHLVSKSGSDPVRGLCYGLPVPGMVPGNPQLEPEPLVPGREYCLLVEARSWSGTHSFSVPPSTRTSR